MTADIGTTLDMIISADVLSSIPLVVFQGKQLDADAAINEL